MQQNVGSYLYIQSVILCVFTGEMNPLMLKDIKEHKIDTVVFYKLDRISRNVSDFSNIVNEFDKYNISFLSATESIENVTPSGRAMMFMISVFAQLERDTIAERIRDNMIELAKTGRWLRWKYTYWI